MDKGFGVIIRQFDIAAVTNRFLMPLQWFAEEEDVAIGVGDLEAAQSVVGISQRCAEGYSAIDELGSESIRIIGEDIGVPPHIGMALRVGQWSDFP